MANTKKTPTTEAASATDAELVKMLQEQVKMLTEQISKMSVQPKVTPTDITSRKVVVMSLINNPATLSTGKYGSGTKYHFPKYGSTRRIKFDDLEKLVNVCKEVADDTHNDTSFFERGEFYIADKEVVEELGLSECYEEILDKKKIDEVVALKDDTAVMLFQGANDEVRENIVRLMVEKIKEGKQYDLNLVRGINDCFGKDILEIAKNTVKK